MASYPAPKPHGWQDFTVEIVTTRPVGSEDFWRVQFADHPEETILLAKWHRPEPPKIGGVVSTYFDGEHVFVKIDGVVYP